MSSLAPAAEIRPELPRAVVKWDGHFPDKINTQRAKYNTFNKCTISVESYGSCEFQIM